jgi:hypothetical protein
MGSSRTYTKLLVELGWAPRGRRMTASQVVDEELSRLHEAPLRVGRAPLASFRSTSRAFSKLLTDEAERLAGGG